ncbi:DeoR/GlpR family DNA-binding transcription regulator [Ensifer soli]|uniref:DeoR/GlpR family DNA-binding transcription regulator n=1 Tax=Ciceribacter sp. sgz301302 TaxID=3342379 RepID=UPI0035B90872
MDNPPKRVEIIPAKRRAMILEYLKVNGTASIQELAEVVGGSPSTVRRDLENLTETGNLERTHGGALLVPPMTATFEREPSLNAHMQHAQKLAIGREAARRLKGGESVIFDSSSTVRQAVKATVLRNISLTVVTNDVDIAAVCSEVPQWRAIVVGGTLKSGTSTLLGEPGESFFETIHADVCFVGTYAVTNGLLTDASIEVAAIKRRMIRSARRSILLVDSTKFQAPAFATFGTLSDMAEVITDDGIGAEVIAGLRAAGRTVTVVPTQPAATGP